MSLFNTDIDFSTIPQLTYIGIRGHLKRHKASPFLSNFVTENEIIPDLPDEFSWGIVTVNDSIEIKEKKKLITKPQNQYQCGSCYAMAVATCINDAFVVSGLKWNPNISTTYLMQIDGDKCRGGNPANLLKKIQHRGAISNRCVDYSWCTSNNICTNSSTNYIKIIRNEMNEIISPDGCFFSTFEENGAIKPIIRHVYKIKNTRTENYEKSIGTAIETQRILKALIYKNGPIIMGFYVHDNFHSGNFAKHKGIYFDNGNYNLFQKKFNSPIKQISINKMAGHAVVIVGWGSAFADIDNNGNKKHVPYWHCRNTFGSRWGEKGYFKYAMFPYNKQIRKESLGGYLVFEISEITMKEFPKTTIIPTSLQRNEKYYQQSENIGENADEYIHESYTEIIIVITVCVILFILFLF